MKEEYLSIGGEPAHQDGNFEANPAEKVLNEQQDNRDPIESIRDSVGNEPAITGCDGEFLLGNWIEEKRKECSKMGSLGVSFLAGLAGGPFAILGALITTRNNWYGVLYMVLIGPVIEELLKQSGMIYLLEKKPYRVFSSWQFVLSALISAAIFSVIENLLYIHVYTRPDQLVNPQMFAQFRWTICTAVHLGCSLIASLGMIRVWKKQLVDGKTVDLSTARHFFIIAIFIHGAYNLMVIFLDNYFMK